MSRRKDKTKPDWKARVKFVSFKSDAERNRAYREWVRLYIKCLRSGKKRKGEGKGEDVRWKH